MEHRFTVVAGGARAAGPEDREGPLSGDTALAQAAAEELLLMGIPRVNVLLAGRDALVSPVLRLLLDNVAQPIATWSPGQLFVPPPIDRRGTLVLHEVGALALQDQIQLLGWSAHAMGNTQVISTTSAPLLPRVSAGGFIDTLYYRLNTVYVDVTGSTDTLEDAEDA